MTQEEITTKITNSLILTFFHNKIVTIIIINCDCDIKQDFIDQEY